MLNKYLLLLCFILCLYSGVAIAQNTARPNVIVPNGFEVNSYTGNLYQARTDLKIPGQGVPVDITFSYNVGRRNRNWGFGKGWTFTYNMAYTVDAEGVRIERADGKRDLFRKSGTTYAPPTGVFESLVEYQTGKFYLQTKDNHRYYFDNATHKRLTKLQDAKGNAVNLVYTDSLLNTLTDGAGHSLGFSWTNGRLTSITDNSCQPIRKINYEYDAKGNPIKVINPLGDFVRYYYDSTARVIGYTDEGGNNMSMQYNEFSAITRINSCATSHQFTYVPTQRKTYVTEKVNGQSVVTIYTYDTQERVATKKGNCCGFNVDYTYDNQDNITSKRDGNNKETKYEYDNRGNVIKETDPAGNFNTYAYDAVFNKLTRYQDKNGNVSTYQYDANGNLMQINWPLAVTQKYTYDAKGNKLSETDPNGNITAFEYNASGQLTKTTNAEGGVTQYTYDCHGNKLTETDPRSNTTKYEYNSLNQLIKKTDALNQMTTYTYDKLGSLVGETNALGKTTTYTYDGLKRRISTIWPLGNTTMIAYDEQGNIIKETDPNGNNTTYTYNNRKQPLTITDALGNTITYTYDEAGNRLTETDKRGGITRFEYDDLNRLIKKVDALGGTTTSNYDAEGNLIAETDANGNATSYEYDGLHRLTKVTDALNKSIEYTYDKSGNRLSLKDKNGNITTYAYTKLNRIKTVTDAFGGTSTITFDASRNKLTETDPMGNITSYAYDALNRRTTVVNALNERTTHSYDPVGNVKIIVHPNGNTVNNTYDDNNRLVSTTDDLGLVAGFSYDQNGNIVTEQDGNRNSRIFVYDGLNRQIQVKDALNKSTLYTYDANSNITSQQDRNGKTKTFGYDALNRKISEIDALKNTTRFSYDAVGNLLSLVDAKNNTTSYNYNSLNRLTKETYADGTNRQFSYDANSNPVSRKDNNGTLTTYTFDALNRLTKRTYPGNAQESFTYDASGRRLTANNGNASITFTYDKLNRLLTETLNGKTTSYAYNTASRTRMLTYPSGRTIVEELSKRSLLTSLKEGTNTIASFEYDLRNRLLKKSFLNGYSIDYTYNANNWLATLTAKPNNVVNLNYTYDNEGNKLTVLKNHRSTHSEKFVYDDLYQLAGFFNGKLTGEVLSDTTSKSVYNYDELHNRIASLEGSVVKTYTANNVNAYTSIKSGNATAAHVYDKNGNNVNDGSKTYAYDFENRLAKVNNGTIAEHFYDALGRRIKTIANGKTITYFFNDKQILEERNDANSAIKTYIYGTWIDDLISYSTAGTTYYVINNEQGSPLAILNNSGIVERYEYSGFGNMAIYTDTYQSAAASIVGNEVGFTGRPYLAYQEAYDFRSRVYQQATGRFPQRDILEYNDGFNSYAAYFAPNKIDPSGTVYQLAIPAGVALFEAVVVALEAIGAYISRSIILKAIARAGINATVSEVIQTLRYDEVDTGNRGIRIVDQVAKRHIKWKIGSRCDDEYQRYKSYCGEKGCGDIGCDDKAELMLRYNQAKQCAGGRQYYIDMGCDDELTDPGDVKAHLEELKKARDKELNCLTKLNDSHKECKPKQCVPQPY